MTDTASDPVRRREFEGVYRQHFAFVWRSLRRLGVRDADLPDAVQDTFLVVYRRLDDFDRECKVTTWLYGICIRVASDRARKASARHEQLQEAPLPLRARHDEAQFTEGSDRRRLLQRALDTMPEDQRTVFILFELEGWSGDRIADALGIPVPTVHSRLRLARVGFRRVVEAWRAREEFGEGRSGVAR